MKTEILLLIVAAVLGLTWAQREIEGFKVLGPIPSLGRSTTTYYYISTVMTNWNDAFKSCVEQQGQLATPSNPALDEALRQYMVTAVTAGTGVWVGGKASGTTWRWQTTNQEFTYQKFYVNQSSCKNANSCVNAGHISTTLEWVWCSYDCVTVKKYVCEF